MASRTQIRLEQLTGSIVDIKNRTLAATAINNAEKGTAASLTGSSVADLFGYVGAALHRIHGAASNEPFNNTAYVLSDGDGNQRINYNSATNTQIHDGGGSLRFRAGDSGDVTIHNSSQGTIATFADTAFTFTQASTFNSNVTVDGNLTVAGDVNYRYVTSSIVEFNDPMLVTNAIDTTSNPGLLVNSASFPNRNGDLEAEADGSERAFDYGVVSKRSLNYADQLGAINGPAGFPGTVSENADGYYNAATDGLPFAVFKVALATPLDKSGANPDDATRGSTPVFNLNNVRSNVQSADLLGAMKGAYVVVSGSGTAVADAKKSIGIIKSHDSANNRVTIQMLANNEIYGGLTVSSADHDLSEENLGAALNESGSIHLLNAYSGIIQNKSDNIFHVAAAAITGSGDNRFISGSANILQYGGLASARLDVFSNSVISGSKQRLQAVFDNSTPVGDEFIFSSLNTTDLVLSSSNTLKLVAGTGQGIILPTNFSFNANDRLSVDGQGVLTAVPPAASADSNTVKAVMSVKTSIPAGSDNVILTGSSTSEHFAVIGAVPATALPATLGDQRTILSDAEQFKKLEVYVNGQLLTSGSHIANMPPTDGDYIIASRAAGDGTNNLSGSFAFDLETDDIITLIRKT